MESAISVRLASAIPDAAVKARRDSQGSLPKTGSDTYLYENPTEL
jgi:hypothetical protein